jgi:sialate O-acetylesterase
MNPTRKLIFSAVVAVAALAGSPAMADVKPHGLISDGAVLQRGIRVPIWGTAGAGERVTVRLRGQKASTVARPDGSWMVWLKPMKAGGPLTMTIAGSNKVEVKNLLVGEVWVASGQSNMEWSVAASASPQETIAKSADPMLRLVTIAKATSHTPARDVTVQWKECGPESVGTFSAVAYHFGKELRRELKVPVGLINASWGGTVAEAWTRRGTLEASPALQGILTNYQRARTQYLQNLLAYHQAMTKYQEDAHRARQAGQEPPRPPAEPVDPERPNNPNRPSVLYNAMIAPLIPYAIRGAIWYQGESNAGRAYEYQTLFPTMIRNWREDWGQGDFPFLFVQLAPFMAIQPGPADSAWAELREAQRLTTLTVPHTGMAVITDVGDERDIHPRQKEPVGKRLAQAALAMTYGKDVEASGPTFKSIKVKGNRAIVSFHHAKGGLVAKGDKITGFTIAGKDGKWVNADATVRGSKVIVSSPQVQQPVAVRYGWANYPVVNLWNKQGLPASPFRTDTFRITTQPMPQSATGPR